jgi:hypothetical protein
VVDAVCRAHGKPGEFQDGLWIHRHSTPRFYPNAVTLSAAGSKLQLESIRELVATIGTADCGVKDSFCTLDLEPAGFQILFEAEWIHRPAAVARPDFATAAVGWTRISSASELAAWEAAWAGEQVGERPERIFRPSLLMDANVAFFAADRDGRIVAGAIANRTGNVVGLSNLFVPPRDADALRAGCVAAVVDTFPGLPIVGYESGSDLAGARALGFESLGPLRVWVRQGCS